MLIQNILAVVFTCSELYQLKKGVKSITGIFDRKDPNSILVFIKKCIS